jgi:iron complex outermembrane receptor protein
MLRVHALRGVSAVAMGLVLVAPARQVSAQSGQALPSVTVEAPAPARAKPAKPRNQTASTRQQARPVRAATAPPATNVVMAASNATPSAARDSLNQAPAGQTATTIDRS